MTSVTLEGISPSGSTLDIAVSKFETGHYAATTDLEPGLWEFKLDAITRDGEQIATTFGIDVDAADSVAPTAG